MTANDEVATLLAKMTILQKVKLLTGVGWWHTKSFPEFDIPAVRFSDGPNGARGTRFFNGVPSSCFPSSTGIGSSFDVELAKTIGEALGEECRAKSTHVLLGPTVNTQRSPLGGRGFESFSEDPFLNGTIAASYINGLQSKGVSATIKHFVANDQEFERFSSSSEVSERALREIYLKPFQIAIKHANPHALMTAYNRVNGTHASENTKLLHDILLKEWGYQGLVMSDWTGTYSTVESLKAGLDLEMPGPPIMRGETLIRCLIGRKISPSDIDKRAERVLRLVQQAKASGIPFDGPEGYIDTPELRKLLRMAAAESIVLLKNEKGILPITSTFKKIAVIGPNAKQTVTSGGGSASLLSTYKVSPLEGIRKAAEAIGAEVTYALGTPSHKYLPLLDPYIRIDDGVPGGLLEFWNDVPAADFMSTSPQFSEQLPRCIWNTATRRSYCPLLDGVDADKVNLICWMRYTTKFIPDEDGDWDFGLNVTGHGNLFIDQTLIVHYVPVVVSGDDVFDTKEIRGVANNLKAGQEYNLEIRVANKAFATQPINFPCWGVIRAGGIRAAEPDISIKEAADIARESDVAILVIGLNNDWETEGVDRHDMELPGLTNKLVTEIIQANPNTVVVNQSGTPVRMPWANQATTLLQAFYGGNELGNGLADVLFGVVNPSAKLPLTFPVKLEDNPSYSSFGKESQGFGKVHYNEGIFVGYRSYELRKLDPLFPFGFGLSYTTFDYNDLKCSEISEDGKFQVSFNLKNVGKRSGREVAQVYISDSQSSLPRPSKELKDFTKIHLEPGEMKRVTIQLDKEALGFYNDQDMRWTAESGKFGVHVGASSADIRLNGEVELNQSLSWTGL